MVRCFSDIPQFCRGGCSDYCVLASESVILKCIRGRFLKAQTHVTRILNLLHTNEHLENSGAARGPQPAWDNIKYIFLGTYSNH